MKWLAAFLLSAAFAATPTIYLPFPTRADAEARSRAQCVHDGCEGLKWPTIALPDGRVALAIVYPVKPSMPNSSGLTMQEWGRLKTAKQLGIGAQ